LVAKALKVKAHMPSKVKAVNLHKSYKLNTGFVQSLAADVLGIINKSGAAELELVFLDDKSMKKFNKRYALKNRTTDVLSFNIGRNEFGQKAFLGEIMISLDTARRNSRLYGTDFTDEIVLYMIHGILHLFGYDDESAGDSREMTKKQNKILDKLCVCRNLSEVLTPR
jgi:probable rRNA maturation factor